MTKQELRQMAEAMAAAENMHDDSKQAAYANGAEDGARKMLELVFAALDAKPIYTHYDMDDALKPFQELLP